MKILVPEAFFSEAVYVLKVLLCNVLEYEPPAFVLHQSNNVEILFGNRKIILHQAFFVDLIDKKFNYLNIELPQESINYKNEETLLPFLYGRPLLAENESGINIGYDVLGSAFFFLSRWEELDSSKFDDRDRFPGRNSFAYKRGLLNRALVNEYAEFLLKILLKAGCVAPVRKRSFKITPSHDVDKPFLTGHNSWKQTIVGAGVEIIRRKSSKSAIELFKRKTGVSLGFFSSDPYAKFSYIMNLSERNNTKSAFYFIAGNHAGVIDGRYSIYQKPIKRILKEILKRGHEVGVHGSYLSFNNEEIFTSDLDKLQKLVNTIQPGYKIQGNRQHYLRIQTPQTFRIMQNAGVIYDTSMSFADMPGFRCGICTEFPVYDVLERKELKIIEKPLILMECSLLDDKYMGLGKQPDKAWKIAHELKHTCKKHNGEFTVLWHNHCFLNKFDVDLYTSLIS